MTHDWVDVTREDTLAKVLRHNALRYGDEIAMREKDLGLWREHSWSDYHNAVRDMALGMRELGIGYKDVVAIIGDNRPQWTSGAIAAHALRAASLGIYRDALDEEVSDLLNYSAASIVLAEDEEQVDKLLGLNEPVPSVKHIVYSDARGLRKYDDSRLLALEDVLKLGADCHARDAQAYDALVDAGDGNDVAILCTTSGTTSKPKLAMLQAGPFLAHVHRYLEAEPKNSDDEYVSVLPLPWIMEQIYCLGKALVCRMKTNFVEESDTMMHDMREIGPTFLLLAPRTWESIAADVRSRIMDSSRLKRWLYEIGMNMGLQALEQGRRSTLATLLVYGALKDRLGLSKLRAAATGGAALGPETFKFFLAMGIPLRQLYGQTELLGAYTIHRPDDVDFDTVGFPFRDCKIRIEDPDSEGVGEIVTHNPNCFLGYYNNEEETRAELREGWMYTGDAGYFNDRNHLVVIDRVKDLSNTATGVRFSPQYIENKLKFSPFVAEAVILGAGRDYLSAMICIRYSIMSKWAEKNRIAFTTYTDLAARDEVYELIRAEVEKVNGSLPEAQRIRRFLLLYKELDADDGELTRTRKVRRSVINDKYADIIDTMYSDRPSVDIDTRIAFQDGSSQRIKTVLRVIDLVDGEHRAGVRAA